MYDSGNAPSGLISGIFLFIEFFDFFYYVLFEHAVLFPVALINLKSVAVKLVYKAISSIGDEVHG